MMRIVTALCLVFFTACGLTQRVAVRRWVRSGMVDDSRLQPGPPGSLAELRWVNPEARWTEYHKLIIMPVTFWAGADDAGISGADQQALCDYFTQALRQQFGAKFKLVDRPGRDTMRLFVALTDAEAATPGLRSISMVVPQARVLATLKYAATGTYPFVGGAQVEARITDSLRGTVLGEWVDRRMGGGSIEAAAQWQWGDAENAMNAWATKGAAILASWTSGATTP